MAFSLNDIRRKKKISLHGRKAFLTYDDFAGGFKDVLRPVTNATSDTTGTALLPYGMHTVVTTTNDTWTLTDPPYAGLEVSIATISTSTGTHTISPAAATIYSTNGVAGSAITMDALGDRVRLVSLSTAAWMAFPSAATAISS
jgi:hypothetical protein